MASGEDEPRNCAVCGDRATGYHFHALTCEGCKGFFRRTVNKSTSLTCPFAGSCEVNKAQRRHCPACRLQKCLDAGMKKDNVITFMVQQIIKFTKDLPLFRSLPMEDQISLLKGAAIEICHIALNTTFCLQTQNFLCGPLRYTIEDAAQAGFQEEFLEFLFGFHRTLRQLQLQEPEYVLMAAMALFSPDRPGITCREEIDQLQEEMALTLQNYIQGQQPRPRDRFLYAKLLGLLADLRSIHDAFWYQIQNIQGLSTMMPLLQEICS
ncbi:nuclear receptor subfamily 1 group I member 3 isoform X3 [Bos indicus x Bos taurus]|uniref:nuclear receptor subfamily 1 group I member 3 isoform X3 n=1 Tax=Bos indicus x Bos taurus TaxID=30522 RepID=UPI000F7D1174|nr:nuclear receptor subfamily 1 group I member 3 isoform X3 [Bos indicus x Bos taurus]